MQKLILVILLALAFVQLASAIGPRDKLKKSKGLFENRKPPAKKLIHYVTLDEETGAYEFSQQVLVDVQIEPKKNWIAKAFWNGNDYNTTG